MRGMGDGGATGIFDGDERLKALSAAGDPLERLAQVVDFEVFRGDLAAALSRSARAKGGRPASDAVLMFKVLEHDPVRLKHSRRLRGNWRIRRG